MRVAWLTHQLESVEGAENGENLLPGRFPGGAEFSNYSRRKLAPKGVEVRMIHPSNWQEAMEYDKIIIGATDFLHEIAVHRLSEKNPVIAITHPHPATDLNKKLFESASVVIGCTPAHIEASVRDFEVKNYSWVLSPIDPRDTQVKEKEDFALHAARRDWWKGEQNARSWASINKIELQIMQKEPREKVLETMSRAKYFVHLPLILDAEPQACIEAVLSGCQMVVNNLVGLTSVPNWQDPDALRALLSTAGSDFWHLALN